MSLSCTVPAANQLCLAEMWGSQDVLKDVFEACPSNGLGVALANVVLPALVGNPLEILTHVQRTDVFRRIVGLIQKENPLDYFDKLIEFFLVLSLVERGTDIVEFRGARVLGPCSFGWWIFCHGL